MLEDSHFSQQQLLDKILDTNNSPMVREEAGCELSELGDPRPGVCDLNIAWCEVPEGEFTYQDHQKITLPGFFIAKYPITNTQFQQFVQADDGYRNIEWWKGLARQQPPLETHHPWAWTNHPYWSVFWYNAVAFCRWLSQRLGYKVQLPTEWQWEKAAKGTEGSDYPWGNSYLSGYANIDERSENNGPYYLGRTSTVGIYPQGASQYGVVDMCGNVRQWCLNEYDAPYRLRLGGEAFRVVRGGSWSASASYSTTTRRHWFAPVGTPVGFRVACQLPR
jgi:formylglycine-generating enzyme required for sulfatase activity